jgi:hypothetical protein
VRVTVVNARQPGRVGSELEPSPGEPGVPGSPLVEVRAFTVAGRVRVQTPRRSARRWLGRSQRRNR